MLFSKPTLRNPACFLRECLGRFTHGPFRPRYSSNVSSSQINFETIKAEMLRRQPAKIWEVMSPTNSYLLSLSLADYLPPQCDGPNFSRLEPVHPVAKLVESRRRGRQQQQQKIEAGGLGCQMTAAFTLPPGHELVYFPPQLSASQLQPDGTDPSHSPGYPFERRMWAAGSIQFGDDAIPLDSGPAVCVETISDVSVKGVPGEEKIFVQLLREYMQPDEYLQWSGETPPRGETSPVSHGTKEHRTLVFMREKSPEEAKADAAKSLETPTRIIKPPHQDPDFSVTLTPSPTLLFHFSALSFNAHAIHLNPEYCRTVEGYHNLLVHGPLSLTLMLTVLRSQLDHHHHHPATKERIQSIDYRNLAPLYVGEAMEVCVKRKKSSSASSRSSSSSGGEEGGIQGRRRKWDVWVKGKDGSLCIKGTATTITTTTTTTIGSGSE